MDAALKKKLLAIKELINAKSYREALDDCQIMIYKNPKIYQVHLFAGLCYDKLDQLGKAEISYKEALDIKPDEPNGLKALCDLYSKMGEFEKSVEYIEKVMKLLSRDKKEDILKYRQWMVKLVKIYEKNEDMQKIDALFQELIQNQPEINEEFAEVAEAYYKTGITNQCLYIQNFQLMGINPKTNSHKPLQPNAKQKMNYVIVEIIRYLNSVKLQYKMQQKDISAAIFEMRQYFPYNSCFLMLYLLDDYAISNADYVSVILQQVYCFLQGIYNKKKSKENNNCYLNIEIHEPQMFAICMKLGYEYVAFCKEFFTLDASFNQYYEQFETDAKNMSLQKVRQEYINKINCFILRECRQISRISENQNVEHRLQKLKSRILKLDGSYLEEIMAKMAMNSFVNYQKLDDMKNLLKVRLRNSRIKEGLEEPTKVDQINVPPQKMEIDQQKASNKEKEHVAPQPHLYKYYYDYLYKIAKIYRSLDEEYDIEEILQYIVKNDPNDLKYAIQKLWLRFSKYASISQDQNEGKHIAGQVLAEINTLQPLVFGPIKSDLLRKKTIIQIYLNQTENILDGLKLALGTDRSFQNLTNMGVYYFKQQNYERALNFLKEAFVIKQDHYHLNRFIFIGLLKTHKKFEAFSFLQRIYEGFPNVFWINYSLAMHETRKKKLEDANRYLSKSLEGLLAGLNNIYHLSYQKTVDKQLKSDNQFTHQYMIHQNQYRVLFDEIIVTEEQINKIYPLASTKYFETDKDLKQIRIETQLGQNFKLLGRNKSSYNHLYTAYQLIQKAKSLEIVWDHRYILQQILTYKEFATSIFYMKFYNESQAILKKTIDIITNFESEFFKQLKQTLLLECQALSFEVSVAKLEQMMKFQSYQTIKDYIMGIEASSLIEKVNQSPQSHTKCLNFLKSKYQYEILYYMHSMTGGAASRASIQRCLSAIHNFVSYFNVSVKDIGEDVFYNSIVELSPKQREMLMEGLEDYCVVEIICKKHSNPVEITINADFLLKLIQIFPKSTIFYIVYGVLTENNKQKIAAFLKCIQMQKQSPISIDLLACLYLKESDYVTACNLFLKSLQIDLFNPKSYIGLCTCLFSIILQSMTQTKSNHVNFEEQQQLIHKCLNKIKSYMQFLKLVDPSQNYQLLRFLKMLVSDDPVSVFEAKSSLEHIYRSISHKYKDTLVYKILGQAVWWGSSNIWSMAKKQAKQSAMFQIMQIYFQRQSLIKDQQKGESEIARALLKRIKHQIKENKLNQIANHEIRIKLKCRILNQMSIAVNLFIKAGKISENDQTAIIQLCIDLQEKQKYKDEEIKKLQRNCKEAFMHCIIMTESGHDICRELIEKLKNINNRLLFREIPSYQHIRSLFLRLRTDIKSQHNLETQKISNRIIKQYIIYSMHMHPNDPLLRKILVTLLMAMQKKNSLNLKLHKNVTHQLQNLLALHHEKTAFDEKLVARVYKKNVLLNNDPQSWIGYIHANWTHPNTCKEQLSQKWIKTVEKILDDNQNNTISLTVNCRMKAQILLSQMKILIKPREQLNKYQQILLGIQKGCKLDLKLELIKQLSREDQESALLYLCNKLQQKYSPTEQLLKIFGKCEKLYEQSSQYTNKNNVGCFKLFKFLALVEMCHQISNGEDPSSSEQKYMQYIQQLYLIIEDSSCYVHPNTLRFMKCIICILTVNYEDLEQELAEAMETLKLNTQNDQFIINYFEILRAYKQVENEGQGEGYFENFSLYVDQMIGITKEPFYRGFFYMLKAMAQIMVEGQNQEIDPSKNREIKMAKLLDPRAARYLSTK